MTARRPHLSKTLPNGHLAILDRAWMRRYVSRHLRIWYPGTSLVDLVIEDKSLLRFKKSIRYLLSVQTEVGEVRTIPLRGNVPSLDTTREVITADKALRAIWSVHMKHGHLPVTRPLIYDAHLRLFLYEETAGVSLFHVLRKSKRAPDDLLSAMGMWLGSLHHAKLTGVRTRNLRDDVREAGFFRLNFGSADEPRAMKANELLTLYLHQRKSIDAEVRRNARLIHGDYNPQNIIVNPRKNAITVIDLGNAWVGDPMLDLANALVQLRILRWTYRVSPQRIASSSRALRRGYTSVKPLTKSDERRLRIFLAWWSLQVLSYTLELARNLAANLPPQRLSFFINDLLFFAGTNLRKTRR